MTNCERAPHWITPPPLILSREDIDARSDHTIDDHGTQNKGQFTRFQIDIYGNERGAPAEIKQLQNSLLLNPPCAVPFTGSIC